MTEYPASGNRKYSLSLATILLGWIVIILLIRLVLTVTLVYADTTEARYGAIAQLMADTGDWITPWFEPGVPFWGKPPLSFWAQALSFEIFGVSEFAGRLPSWLATIGIIALTYKAARSVLDHLGAVLAAAIFATMVMTYISAGTVMTDSFLALGVALTVTSLVVCLDQEQRIWRWGFFVGIALGVLAKGPIAIILTGFPIFIWAVFTGSLARLFSILPWGRGTLLAIIIAVPWYLIAEIKTPGFIDYFLVGEHFKRFVVSGWEGDLYGSAHDQPRGMMWIFLLQSAFPWILLFILTLAHRLTRGRALLERGNFSKNGLWLLLLMTSMTPVIFFTFSGNILATYTLPGLPFLAILGAGLYRACMSERKWLITLAFMLLITPLVASALGAWASFNPDKLKTEGPVIQRLEAQQNIPASELVYLGDLKFSARFYSDEKVRSMSQAQFLTQLESTPETLPLAIGVPRQQRSLIDRLSAIAAPIDENLRYVFFSGAALQDDRKDLAQP